MAKPVYADSILTAQQQYQALIQEKASLPGTKPKKEERRAGVIDRMIDGLKAAFPGLSLEKDYTALGEVSDNPAERPATLAEIQALANSIPIPSLGAQGSSTPPLTSDGAAGFSNRMLLGIGIGGVALIAVVFFLFRK